MGNNYYYYKFKDNKVPGGPSVMLHLNYNYLSKPFLIIKLLATKLHSTCNNDHMQSKQISISQHWVVNRSWG